MLNISINKQTQETFVPQLYEILSSNYSCFFSFYTKGTQTALYHQIFACLYAVAACCPVFDSMWPKLFALVTLTCFIMPEGYLKLDGYLKLNTHWPIPFIYVSVL